MAELSDILSSLSKTESNKNNTSFIKLMSDISGNPSDNVDSADDTDSIYGHIVQMYDEMVSARASDQDITDAIDKIVNLTASAEQVESNVSASASLVDSNIHFEIPRGVEGEPGYDGLTPIIEFTEQGGVISSEVIGYDEQATVPIEEW